MDVTFNELDKQVVGAGLFAAVPVKLTKKGWSCHSCRHRWQEDELLPASIQESNRPE
jgi:hypothetical protein